MNHQVFISYSQQDCTQAAAICDTLENRGIRCWIAPRDILGGHHWDEAIVAAIPESRLLLVIISAHAEGSLHVKREISLASDHGIPILPVRVEDIPIQRLRYYLGTCQWIDAYPPPMEQHREELLAAVRRLLGETTSPASLTMPPAPNAIAPGEPHLRIPGDGPGYRDWEPLCGALQVHSPFYVSRPMDDQFYTALSRQDSLVLIKGARQMGKTSLLAQGLHHARTAGRQVVWTDLQTLNASHLSSLDRLYQTLARMLADQLGIPLRPEQHWDPLLGPNLNFERFVLREVLEHIEGPLLWAIDETDRIIGCDFADEVFGLLRSWHNARAIDRHGAWWRLTVAMAYATEAYLPASNSSPSPFNVGTRITLEDFSFEQVLDLNLRYGSPLRNDTEVAGFYRLLGGQPFLARNGLHTMITANLDLGALEQQSSLDNGPFGDHLRRLLVLLGPDQELRETVREVLRGRPSPSAEHFFRLRSAGILAGNSVHDARPRCQLYASYLERHLL